MQPANPNTLQETKSFQNFQETATYLKGVYDRTKKKGPPQVKVKCQFHGRFIKEVKCYFDHDYQKKIPPEQLDNLLTLAKLFKTSSIGMSTGNKKTDVFEIKLTSSTLTKREMEEFKQALSTHGLAAGIVINKGFVGQNVRSDDDLIPVGIVKQLKQEENPSLPIVKGTKDLSPQELLLKHVSEDKVIKLSGKNWVIIPVDIAEKLNANTFMSSLDLSHNHLNNLDGLKLPGFIKKIDLSHNFFTEVPEAIKKASFLEMIDLRDNPISSIPSWLCQLNFGKVQILWNASAKNEATSLSAVQPLSLHMASIIQGTIVHVGQDGQISHIEPNVTKIVPGDEATRKWLDENKKL